MERHAGPYAPDGAEALAAGVRERQHAAQEAS
jgi:hypothetical protein